jgi:hypothetical protein
MHTPHRPDAVNDRRDDRGPADQLCLTYRQIATILTARDGTRVSPDQVERMCRTAEAKLARGLLANIDLPHWLRAESIIDRGGRIRNAHTRR